MIAARFERLSPAPDQIQHRTRNGLARIEVRSEYQRERFDVRSMQLLRAIIVHKLNITNQRPLICSLDTLY
jgi:hypothetical protein